MSLNAKVTRLTILAFLSLMIPLLGQAAIGEGISGIKPEKVHQADSTKSHAYIQDGLVVGGHRAIQNVVIRDFRYAINSDFERIVLDLEGSRGGGPAAIAKPPYYQVAISPEMQRIVFTLFGSPKLAFDVKKSLQSTKRSKAISKVEFFPMLESDRWTFVLHLKDGYPAEIFELKSPTRVIVDLKTKGY